MRAILFTVGDPSRLTGGYLYHDRLMHGLRAMGIFVTQVSLSGAAAEQQIAALSQSDPARDNPECDVVVVDALARLVAAPLHERWQAKAATVALVHELPSDVNGSASARDMEAEAELLRVDRVVAVSETGRANLISRGAAPNAVHVVSPGCDRLTPIRADRRADDIAAPPTALCVAQWIPRKGITTLVQAWRHVRIDEARLVLVGETGVDPIYERQVRETIEGLAGHSVEVRGPVDDVSLGEAYATASLFVLPSHAEGYGMAYAEALLNGLPIVASNVAPIPQIVGPEAGLFVPPNDSATLGQAIQRVLDDDELRASLATGARRRALTLPTWDDTVRQFAEVMGLAYADFLARRARP